MRRSVRPLDHGRLDSLTVNRLLAYRDKLLSLEDSAELSDLEPQEIQALDPTFIWFKADPRWRVLYDSVLQRLSGRGHTSR